jgi:PAS domain S-box-containing protein/diguanylate cyclase (GGDEF)-like protein
MSQAEATSRPKPKHKHAPAWAPWLEWATRSGACLVLIVFAAATLRLLLGPVSQGTSHALDPSIGLAMLTLWLGGRSLAAPTLVAVVLAEVLWAGAWSLLPIFQAACVFSGAWAAAEGLRLFKVNPNLDGRHDLLLLGAAAALAAPSVSGLLASLAQWLPAMQSATAAPWLAALWLRDAVGGLVVATPFLAIWGLRAPRHAHTARWVGATALACATVACIGFGFSRPPEQQPHQPQGALLFLFLPHMLLAWLGQISHWRVASVFTALLLVGTAALHQRGMSPFTATSALEGLTLLWGYQLTLMAMPLLVARFQREARRAHEVWMSTLDASRIASADWDDETDMVELSKAWIEKLGLGASRQGHSRQTLWNLLHPDDRPHVREALLPLAHAPVSDSVSFRMQGRGAQWRWFRGQALVVSRNRQGSPSRVRAIARDITQELASKERQELSTQLFQHLHEGLLVTDAQYRVLDANPTFTRITGYSREEMLGQVPVLLRPVAPDRPGAQAQAAVQQALREHGSWHGELEGFHRDGSPCLLQVTISAVFNLNNEVAYHVLAMIDVSQTASRQRVHAEPAHRLVSDPLTGLGGLESFVEQLERARDLGLHNGWLLNVTTLDIDHFHELNQRHGRALADSMLVELSKRLSAALLAWSPDLAVLCRLEADRFALLYATENTEDSNVLLNKLLRKAQRVYQLEGQVSPIELQCSVGSSISPLDDSDARGLLRHATSALLRAKLAGGACTQLFQLEDRVQSLARARALTTLQQALQQDELRLHYQPEVHLSEARVVGVEALLRWQHPQHGVIAPAQFLPMVEHTELAQDIRRWVIDRAIDQASAWQAQGLDLMVHINVSAAHLEADDFLSHLKSALDRHESHVAHRVVLELLESSALSDTTKAYERMQACRALGVRFALDDFGTGYASFAYLKSLPVDLLKIDRSFISDMLTEPQDASIVEGVMAMSKTFGCEVIAEGVNNRAQAARLLELGCQIGQGHGISSPMPADAIPHWITQYKGWTG